MVNLIRIVEKPEIVNRQSDSRHKKNAMASIV
jgi:hypothetical protein